MSQVDKANVTIEREELLSRGWKMRGLVPGQLSQQVFQKGDKLIFWDAETQMVVKGTLDE